MKTQQRTRIRNMVHGYSFVKKGNIDFKPIWVMMWHGEWEIKVWSKIERLLLIGESFKMIKEYLWRD